jgi:predicted ATPase
MVEPNLITVTRSKAYVESLGLNGFKSVRHAELALDNLNVLIGSNGAGKSNLLGYFALLRATLEAKLAEHVGLHGGADTFLYGGAKETKEIRGVLRVRTAAGTGTLYQRLSYQAPDKLTYGPNHTGRPRGRDGADEVIFDDLCAVVKQSGPGQPQQLIYEALRDRVGIFHFDDTSREAPIRRSVYIEDNQALRGDGGNLAAMLYRYKRTHELAYRRIVAAVRKVAPWFDDFALAPQRLDRNSVLLNWRAKGKPALFGPHQLSDGTLRAMALITLFLQPQTDLPDLILVDEPELGLHPHAIELVAGLARSASTQCQVVLATQSTTLVDHFDPEEVVIAELHRGSSHFRRLDRAELADWLRSYSVSELWQKNVIGGGPIP